jgi:Tol biopolymer transport system component
MPQPRDRRPVSRRTATTAPSRTPAIVLVAVAGVALAGWLTWAGFRDRGPVRDTSPAWSPDGSEIAFTSERDGSSDLFVMNADGSGAESLLAWTSTEQSPTWSPAGRLIAFASDRDGQFEIYVMGAGRTTPPRRLTNHPSRDVFPVWSPDARRIAFLSNRDSTHADVYVMNTDGTGVERLTTQGASGPPAFSPDGQRLAFESNRDVYVLDFAGATLRRLTSAPADGIHPSWSPDGRRLVFSTSRDGRRALYTSEASGAGPTPLVTAAAGGVDLPRWSPDGTRVAYVLFANPFADPDLSATMAIYVVEVESGRVTRLSR